MDHSWKERAEGIHQRFVRLAQAKGSLLTAAEVSHYLALAICGEAGELANLVKKGWRGDAVSPDAIRNELADIRIYLEHLSRHLGIDLDEACKRKLAEVDTRLVRREQNEAL